MSCHSPSRIHPGLSWEQTVALPADMPNGNYAALFNLPDPISSLRSRAGYAIQPANTGFNNLNRTAAIAP